MIISPATMIELWDKWLDDNPEADVHQRYYAAGVIDGLSYSRNPEMFEPSWRQTLKIGKSE